MTATAHIRHLVTGEHIKEVNDLIAVNDAHCSVTLSALDWVIQLVTFIITRFRHDSAPRDVSSW